MRKNIVLVGISGPDQAVQVLLGEYIDDSRDNPTALAYIAEKVRDEGEDDSFSLHKHPVVLQCPRKGTFILSAPSHNRYTGLHLILRPGEVFEYRIGEEDFDVDAPPSGELVWGGAELYNDILVALDKQSR